MPPDLPQDARILVSSGARATEALLVGLLAPLVEAARADWRLLELPVRIVVSSRSLRDHVSALLVRRFGPAVAGIEIETLQGLARGLLERVQEPAAPGEALLPILVRAAAQREPLLAQELGALDDGFGAVAGSVRDLLDAGRIRESAEAAEEALAGVPAPAASRARACALVRVACAIASELERLGIDSRASLLARACDALLRDPERALPQRAVIVHGFADATGVATDLLEALVRVCGARVLLDRPPDPCDPGRPDPGCAFSERFAGRLGSAAALAVLPQPPEAPPAPSLLRAQGGESELRGIALRVRALLDEGKTPESIGVVARTLAPYALRLRAHFDRLGIAFSALGARSGPDGTGRRIAAVLSLIERRGETPADVWLDALAQPRAADASLADLRLALHALGVGRLAQLAALDVPQRLGGEARYALPVRHGISLAEDESGELRPRAERRSVASETLFALAVRAHRTCEAFAAWPAEAPLASHLAHANDLLVQALGWSDADPASAPLLGMLAQLAADLPPGPRLGVAELLLLLREVCEALGSRPLGGAGAGVQVLDAIEARARTFEHLFVLGMNRDLFPRIVTEDPLLSDVVRRGLREHGAGVMPDLPLKLGGHDEERYLFAQLLTASPHVTLSWQAVDDDGKERAVSTFIERLWLAGRAKDAEKLPTLWSPSPCAGARPAGEHLVLAGLHAGRAAVAKLLPLALAEIAAGSAAGERAAVDAVARSRLAALDLLEPRGAARGELGPAFGFIGERAAGDARGAGLAITTLEKLAWCPWQAFLSRVLHVEPAPDALEALPAVDALLLGSLLHACVEAIVKAALATEDTSLVAALARGAVRVPWPSDTNMRRLATEHAGVLLEREGMALPGLARVLAERALPLLREVFEQVWRPAEGRPALYGAELTGTLTVPDADGRPRTISFRADLVEKGAERPRLIDLKSGGTFSKAKGEGTRRKHMLASIARGRTLQAAAYTRAAGGDGTYLYADPARSDGHPVFTVLHDDDEMSQTFDEVLRTLLAAWDRGSFLPRLEQPEGSSQRSPCVSCQVAEACARGDSGARRRLARWAAAPPRAEGPALAAARALFWLPARPATGDGAPEEEGG